MIQSFSQMTLAILLNDNWNHNWTSNRWRCYIYTFFQRFDIYKEQKRSYHFGKTFHILKLAVWLFQISFLIFPNSTSNPPKFTKKLLFSREKFHSNGINGSTFSTQLVSTTPKSGSNWRQRLQNLDQISVNDSKICSKLVSTAPNIYGT